MTVETIKEQYEAKAETMIGEEQAKVAAVAQELERRHRSKKDYVIPATSAQAWVADDGTQRFGFKMGGVGGDMVLPFGIGKVAHEQMAEKLGITGPYYRRMVAEAPELWATNVNYWLKEDGRNFMARTLDGNVRAFLSDRARILDNWDLFFHTYERVKAVGAQIVRVDLTDERFYMRCLAPDWAEKLSKGFQQLRDEDFGGDGNTYRHQFVRERGWDDGGEYVIPGVVVSNSEVGYGSLGAEPFIKFAACWNLAVVEKSFRRFHIGRRHEIGEFASDTTRELEDRATWSAVGDLIQKTFDRDAFKKLVAGLESMANEQLADPIEAVDVIVKDYDLTTADRQAILNELVSPQTRANDPGRTVYGLLQAVTAQAKRHEDYNEAIKYERIGGELLEKQLVRVRA